MAKQIFRALGLIGAVLWLSGIQAAPTKNYSSYRHDDKLKTPIGGSLGGFMVNHVDEYACDAGGSGCILNRSLTPRDPFSGTEDRPKLEKTFSLDTSVTVNCCAGGFLGFGGYQSIPLKSLGLSSIRSAIFLEERSTVILSDTIGGNVAELDLSEFGKVRMSKNSGEMDLQPSFIAESDGGYAQLVRDSTCGDSLREIAWFGQDLHSKGQTPLIKPHLVRGFVRAPFKDGLVALYSWAVAENRIFAYGILDSGEPVDASHPYRTGFFSYMPGVPGSKGGHPTAEFVEDLEAFDYYILGLPLIAALDQEVYYLRMEEHPKLRSYDMQKGGQPFYLGELPGDGEPLPRIDDIKKTSDLFGTVEGLSMPAGLYADGGFLYLLHRSPAGDVTRWTLTKMSPDPEERTVRDLGSVRLPTEAAHLTVLFTRDSVLVFEKSSVRPGSKAQDVETMLVLPKDWIGEPGASPLREEVSL